MNAFTKRHNPLLALIAAFLGWLFDGFEIGLFPVIARPALLDMLDMLGPGGEGADGMWMGRITAAFLIGAAIGGAAFGWLGDRIGRVRAMALSILCYSLFSGAAFFAGAPWHLAGFRFLAAHGMTLMVQDLTNPMLAQIPHCLLAAHAPTIAGVETNAMQFYPGASAPEAAVHPGLYRRRAGHIDLSTVRGPGMEYRLEEMPRELPNPPAA